MDITKAQQERDDRDFMYAMEVFWKRWAPDDKYEAAQFQGELSMLMRAAYREAQEPLIKQLAAMAAYLPIIPPDLKKEESRCRD